MKIETTKSFEKSVKPLAKKYRSFKEDYKDFINQLEERPDTGIDLGNGIRKVRMAITSKGKGKSGGARVITFHTIKREGILYLIYAYDKAEYDNIILPVIKELINDLGLA
ncbi:MAG: type II toxin-antitoxin system RelE/ParE family toxin [Muribaculaceae bacterium]|nr:type II toxin-antitoxin system RelE/ParE family toxin [Muribaculaceae bacterium]